MNTNPILQAYHQLFGGAQNYVSPLPKPQPLATPIQNSDIQNANIRMQQGIGRDTSMATPGVVLAAHAFQDPYSTSTAPTHFEFAKAMGALQQQSQAGAQALPMPTPTDTPTPASFEQLALPIFDKYQIPPSVGFGMASAEGGNIGQNNAFNINAVDSNPQAATSYSSPADGIEAFAKLIATNPRYADAYKLRDNPSKMLEAIQNAGYAGDPKDWYQRKLKETPNFPYKSYAEFVKDTPGYKNYQD